MAKRKIIEINRDLCDGCGLCTTACAEGALEMDGENKAVLVKEIFCDGMGACLDVCPTGALRVVERESSEYDAKAAYQHVLNTRGRNAASHAHGASTLEERKSAASRTPDAQARPSGDPPERPHANARCPGSRPMVIPANPRAPERAGEGTVSTPSELRQWPIQLRLVSPFAPYFQESDLLVAADCTAFALGSFHPRLLRGKKLIIACPKLDETESYIEKLSDIIKINSLHSLTVAVMSVPCCSGLLRIVEEAVDRSGTGLDVRTVVVGIDGQIVS